ncbi:hypothetical protein [Pontibacter sp. 172403-2]|uniref:hypothetical protein n=1 Tax=Pontibacter rufus TaxID=2791028 RepID=UPI0018AFCA1D|nr:hypothetical protein [Pontibacter sp. 172403-2]
MNYRFMLKLGGTVALLNMLLNAGIAWLVLHSLETVPLWGPASIASFMLCSGGLAGFIFGYIATRATWFALRSSQALPLHWHLKSQTLIDRLPGGTFNRSFILGLCGILFTYLTLLLLEVQDRPGLLLHEFMVLICIQAALAGAGVTAMAFYRALGDRKIAKTKMAAFQKSNFS